MDNPQVFEQKSRIVIATIDLTSLYNLTNCWEL